MLHHKVIGLCKFSFSILFFILFTSTSVANDVQVKNLDEISTSPIGLITSYFQEKEQDLTIEQAFDSYYQNQFTPAPEEVLTFGIGAKPVWVAFSLDNQYSAKQYRILNFDESWIDSIEITLRNRTTNQTQYFQVGDKNLFVERPIQSRNFQIPLQFEPGINDVMIYAKTADSMVLPMYLLTEEQQANKQTLLQYGYGLVYGYLLALLLYNTLLFLGLRDIRYLLYSGLLASFLVGNIAYTGHGFMWLWSSSIAFQQWGQSLFMILYASSGLVFALYFLDIKSISKSVFDGILTVVSFISIIYVYLALTDKPTALTVLSFICVSSYMLVALGLGLFALYKRQSNAKYFLAAISLGSMGTGITSVAAWGGLPFNMMTFHAAELGMVAEATMLALALSSHFRAVQARSFYAEKMAGTDLLTQLNNRHGFINAVDAIWPTICRHDTPSSILIFDLDNFKKLNDTYGHEVGDVALKHVAMILKQHVRSGDIVARWGGEEFLAFLPETSLDEAFHLAERLRLYISQDVIDTEKGSIVVTSSVGVAQRTHYHHALEPLIDNADKALYEAKRTGKNKSMIYEHISELTEVYQAS